MLEDLRLPVTPLIENTSRAVCATPECSSLLQSPISKAVKAENYPRTRWIQIRASLETLQRFHTGTGSVTLSGLIYDQARSKDEVGPFPSRSNVSP